jgi:hypothetical protein
MVVEKQRRSGTYVNVEGGHSPAAVEAVRSEC